MIISHTHGIVSALKKLRSRPASTRFLRSAEDHVSMGWHAARKLRTAVDGLSRVLAFEIMTAARGIELRAPLRPGVATAAAIAAMRTSVPGPGPDRSLAPENEAAYRLVRSGALTEAAGRASGVRLDHPAKRHVPHEGEPS